MKNPTDAITVSTEFTRKGLRDYVLARLDEESYSDESLYSVFEEFNYRLGLKARSLSSMMEGFGIKFEWMINNGKAIYSPKDELEEYFFTDPEGKEWQGLDAILASLREEVDVDSVANDYWFGRSLEKWSSSSAKEYSP